MKVRLALMVAALWWGSLSALVALVVPLLFAHLPTPALAGNVAARLFSAQTWVSVGCGMILLLIFRSNSHQPSVKWSFSAMGLIVGCVLLALLVEFGVAPRIVARIDLRLWHGVGSALYFLQVLGTGALLWRLAGTDSSSRSGA